MLLTGGGLHPEFGLNSKLFIFFLNQFWTLELPCVPSEWGTSRLQSGTASCGVTESRGHCTALLHGPRLGTASLPRSHLLPSDPCPGAGDLLVPGLQPPAPGGALGAKGWKKHSDAKHAKNYFTDKQQRTGLVSGAELVTYYTNILLKGKEWLKYTHSLTQIKSQCAFSIACPTPKLSAALSCSPSLRHSTLATPSTAAGEHSLRVMFAWASVFNKKNEPLLLFNHSRDYSVIRLGAECNLPLSVSIKACCTSASLMQNWFECGKRKRRINNQGKQHSEFCSCILTAKHS